MYTRTCTLGYMINYRVHDYKIKLRVGVGPMEFKLKFHGSSLLVTYFIPMCSENVSIKVVAASGYATE